MQSVQLARPHAARLTVSVSHGSAACRRCSSSPRPYRGGARSVICSRDPAEIPPRSRRDPAGICAPRPPQPRRLILSANSIRQDLLRGVSGTLANLSLSGAVRNEAEAQGGWKSLLVRPRCHRMPIAYQSLVAITRPPCHDHMLTTQLLAESITHGHHTPTTP